jgi:L-ascorbate metabolism protein UlaG (beta-lactamase superfamily)
MLFSNYLWTNFSEGNLKAFMKYRYLLAAFLLLSISAQAIRAIKERLQIIPVKHASFAMEADGKIVYVDPADNPNLFKELAAPDLILITDVHQDHMNEKTIEAVDKKKAIIVAPKAVADKLPAAWKDRIVVLNNDEKTTQLGMSITAIPMYNLTPDRKAMHTKGRGNGYVINIGGKNVYISGDTEDIPEMRALKNIDVAFICMNLPYTMDINQAASAVLEFKPLIVYPYHHRGQDIIAFKRLVTSKNKRIEVRTRQWYPDGD